jgi:hypothetical protein
MRARSRFTPRIVALSGALLHLATGVLGLAYLALLSWLEDDETLHKRINYGMEPPRDQGPPA